MCKGSGEYALEGRTRALDQAQGRPHATERCDADVHERVPLRQPGGVVEGVLRDGCRPWHDGHARRDVQLHSSRGRQDAAVPHADGPSVRLRRAVALDADR